jgi:hypothetical protein
MERDRAKQEFPDARADLNVPPTGGNGEFEMWHDVFVQQELPWRRFLQSVLLHTAAAVLIWAASYSWLKQQKILNSVFDRSSLVTYTPQEYLPPLDTGATKAPKAKGDPAYAKQPILSVPKEADNRTQTIVTPPGCAGGPAGSDAGIFEPCDCAGDSNRGPGAGSSVCTRTRGAIGDEDRCDCAASGFAIRQGTRWAHQYRAE